jgi:pimeloyl-ACP methyl ester carboxylesterase
MRAVLVGLVSLVAMAMLSTPASAVAVRFQTLQGVNSPGTPLQDNRVGILQVGPRRARNVLVLNPGTSAGATYFLPLAKTVVSMVPGWQVWSVERRENLLEDQSMLDAAKAGQATPQQVFDYYLGYLTNSSISPHYQPVQDADVGFARDWGMNTEIGDLRKVVLQAERGGRTVVVGGHSLGGTITTAYATWDFNGKAGADGLSGLVYIDGASRLQPVSPDQATQSLQTLQTSSPWLTVGGLPAPYAGLFQTTGALGVLDDPNSPSVGQAFSLLPALFKPPYPVTNAGLYGYALNVGTSPSSLALAQAHLGEQDFSTTPAGWNDDGGITPLARYAAGFSGQEVMGHDGLAWYHPQRLSIDGGAVDNGNANPAQSVLDVHATDGHKLPKTLKVYAFAASLGGPGVLTSTKALARQSGIPSKNLTLINRSSTYAHNDPALGDPKKDTFVKKLVPYLESVAGS